MLELRHTIDRRLRFRMGIFLAIGVVILGVGFYDILRGELAWWLALAALLIGAAVGYGLGRMARIRWHDEEERVISQMDVIGFAAILVYVALRLGSNWLFAQFLSGAALSTMSLILLGGALLGRYLGLRHSIAQLLHRGR